jgi:kinetochore protein Spc7/SPC105
MDDKENNAPVALDDQMGLTGIAMSPKKGGRRGRSKSIGPGALDNDLDFEAMKKEAKNRRKSAFIPATRSILSKNEDAEKAARRKTMINRRVSFAPEATLHTWDIIESARDHTTSTDTSENTRRASGLASGESSSPAASSDSDESQDEDLFSNGKPEIANRGKKYRRSSGIPPMNFNNPDDFYSSGADGSSDSSGAEEDDADEEEDFEGNTGTAMSLDIADNTVQSGRSDSSTGSSARLEAALKQAAHMAGTRGIAYDEYGDMSMELAAEEITNAFQPWVQKLAGQQTDAAASMDQENVNPFSTGFNAQISGLQSAGPLIDHQDEDDDVSMDVTRAVGRIVREPSENLESSPGSDGAMEFTQVVGKITSQKRRRSTNGPGAAAENSTEPSTKRQRASLARSSMGSEMDLTMAVGGIHQGSSPSKGSQSRNSSRRSSAADATMDEATMEFTKAVGRIASTGRIAEDETPDENEELTMELTTALGAINANPFISEPRPITPQTNDSPLRSAVNTTPKDQTRYKDAPELGPKKLLTPILQKQARLPADVSELSLQSPRLVNRAVDTAKSLDADASESASPFLSVRDRHSGENSIPEDSPAVYPELPVTVSTTPAKSPIAKQNQTPAYLTPERQVSQQQQAQSPGLERTPLSVRQPRSSTRRSSRSPNKSTSQDDPKSLTDSIKLMSTPRKETLKTVTPKKLAAAHQFSPAKAITPRGRPTPKAVAKGQANLSPAKHLAEDLKKIKLSGEPANQIGLADFLNQAGIKFMDLTTTKRRMTTVATPSKAHEAGSAVGDLASQEVLNLESSVVAAACTVPELELYQHACHELKRYTREGKQMVAELEAETANETPPLLLAYTNADKARKAELDVYMRDMKTNARLRSKEMWYAWRSQLLDELMGGLQTIGENLIKDDDIVSKSEKMIERVLPDLTAQHEQLSAEADALEKVVNLVSESEKEDLQDCRETLKATNATLAAKRELLEQLRQQVKEQDDLAVQLAESKEESLAAMLEANRVREACRGIPVSEIAALTGEPYQPT